jgi:hypothetical protein
MGALQTPSGQRNPAHVQLRDSPAQGFARQDPALSGPSNTQTAAPEQPGELGCPQGMQGWPQVGGETLQVPADVHVTAAPQQRSGMAQLRPGVEHGSPCCGGIVGQAPVTPVVVTPVVVMPVVVMPVVVTAAPLPVAVVLAAPPDPSTTTLPPQAPRMSSKEARTKRMGPPWGCSREGSREPRTL